MVVGKQRSGMDDILARKIANFAYEYSRGYKIGEKDKMNQINESLPHPNGEKAMKVNKIETEKNFKETKKSKIENDLKEIQAKLEELSK